MEAGRELDALVAERVMARDLSMGKHEWREVDLDDRDRCQSTYFCDRCANHAGWVDISELDMSESCKPYCPTYSSDILAAWQVVDRLRSQKCEVEVKSGRWGWDVDFWPRKESSLEYGHIQLPSLPVAICMAALEAVGAVYVAG